MGNNDPKWGDPHGFSMKQTSFNIDLPGKHILIACGGLPSEPDIPGVEHATLGMSYRHVHVTLGDVVPVLM
jgi:pyruvate/2-oxoglutarate dehydrogenase complex dihydrolipoamide dehydrogenase (E3) component